LSTPSEKAKRLPAVNSTRPHEAPEVPLPAEPNGCWPVGGFCARRPRGTAGPGCRCRRSNGRPRQHGRRPVTPKPRTWPRRSPGWPERRRRWPGPSRRRRGGAHRRDHTGEIKREAPGRRLPVRPENGLRVGLLGGAALGSSPSSPPPTTGWRGRGRVPRLGHCRSRSLAAGPGDHSPSPSGRRPRRSPANRPASA